MDKKKLGHKIKIARAEAGLNQEQLGKLLGVTTGSISGYETGRTTVDRQTLISLASVLHKPVSYFEEGGTKEDEGYTKELQILPLNDDNTIRIPILTRIPAGYPSYNQEDLITEGIVSVPRSMFPGAKFAVRAKGDSMEPEIRDGDICVVRPETEAIHNAYMLVKTDEGHCIKQVVKENGTVNLHPINPKYPTFTPRSLCVIGQIIGTVKSFE